MSHSQFALLGTKRFLPLFLTQFLGAFNDNVFKNALVILITYHAAGKVSVDPRQLVTASAGIFILPYFLFSATAGQLADKFDKAKLIRIIKAVEILIMLVAALGFYLENYWLLLFVLFCEGAHSAFFGPLKYSILPEHLKEDELVGGNALVEAATFLAILIGTILGGLLILKPHGIPYISAIIMVTAILGLLSSLKVPAAASSTPGLKVSVNFLAETWRMTRHATREKNVFLSIIGISWFWLMGSIFLVQFSVYGKDVIGADENVGILFLAMFSIGIGIGSLICGRLLKGEIGGQIVPVGAFCMTAGIFALWFFSPAIVPHQALIGVSAFLANMHSWIILASLLVISISGGIYIVPLYTIMQARTEKTYRSRTIAVNNILNALFMAGGSVITMVLLKLNMPVTEIFFLMGIVNIPVAFLVRRIVRKSRTAKGL